LLYRRLREVGFSKPYLTKIAALPTWWDDKLAENPAGYAQCLISLSRHLGLDIKSLQDECAPVRLKDFGICKYKKRVGTTEDELLLSRVIATRASQLAAAAVDRAYEPVLPACDLRQKILEDAPWVGFEQLLDYCWSTGIPVLHVNLFPKGAKRPEGFTLRVSGRPVIVLCREETQPSWQLFILAHELGHVAKGHVPENGAVLDEKVDDNEPDNEEDEADQFAIELLTGKTGTTIGVSGRWPNAGKLAQISEAFGRRNQVDPGHVVLNYAHSMPESNFYPVARSALKHLFPNADAIGLVRDRLAANLDWDRLPEDSSEFLMRMTRQEGDG
jgi:IrrE N-terminal-like domain